MTPTESFAGGFGMMGGGAGAEARYETADQSVSVTLSCIADNPVVSPMVAMPGSAEMMGKVVKVGDQALLDADNNLSLLVGGRVPSRAQGAPSDIMLPVVQGIDFAKVATFDSM